MRQSAARFLALGALVAVLLTSCGDGPDPPAPTSEPSSEPPVGLPVLGQAAQDLEFSGAVEGTMTYATAQCVHIRGATAEKGRFQMALEGSVNGTNHRLRFVINGYTGPGTYSWDGVPGSGPEVTAELDSTYTGHATITVDEPGGSGEAEAFLTRPGEARIYGFFECPGVPR